MKRSIPKTADETPQSWLKFALYFNTLAQCHEQAFPFTVELRRNYSKVYFSHQCNATSNVAYVYVRTANQMDLSIRIKQIIRRLGMRKVKVIPPFTVNGYLPYAAVFDLCTALQKTDGASGTSVRRVIANLHNMLNMTLVEQTEAATQLVSAVFNNVIGANNELINLLARATAPKTKKKPARRARPV